MHTFANFKVDDRRHVRPYITRMSRGQNSRPLLAVVLPQEATKLLLLTAYNKLLPACRMHSIFPKNYIEVLP